MKKIICRFGFTLLLAFGSVLLACSDGGNTSGAHKSAQWKKDVTTDDILRLKWLEGIWRGTGVGQEPFYESYRFEGTSMFVDTLADGSLEKVTDTTHYALINGEFRHTKSGRRSAASEITDNHVQFVPVVGDGNSYRFERQPEGKWRAVLEWPATGDNPAKQVIYNMEPYKK